MKKLLKQYEGTILDPIQRISFQGSITVRDGRIVEIKRTKTKSKDWILPGFVDSHVHIESSMLTPQKFSNVAVKHGTVAVVADPHEIANVGGLKAVDYFIKDAKKADLKIFFGAPSCVPASPFDDCYQPLGLKEVKSLLKRDDIFFLSEMMNFPGVINRSKEVIGKIEFSLKQKKPIDGHAPGLVGEDLNNYVSAGISTDHECFSLQEATEKIDLGMKILIREGSAAKNSDTLHPLIQKHPMMCMFCTDDCHPDDLIKGHINLSVLRSLKNGYNIFDILQVACVNPIKHYNLNVGLLQIGDNADFIVVNNLRELRVKKNIINGINVLEKLNTKRNGKNINIPRYTFPISFNAKGLILKNSGDNLKVIEIVPGELITKCKIIRVSKTKPNIESDTTNDILKLVVINRYKKNEIFTAFIHGFGLKNGAFASSIAHDSHHILATGVDDLSIKKAIEFVIKNKGGISFSANSKTTGLKLPIFGIISAENAEKVAKQYQKIVRLAKENGVHNESPFMTLSFMALTVIPELKISPQGLFDVSKFEHTSLFIS